MGLKPPYRVPPRSGEAPVYELPPPGRSGRSRQPLFFGALLLVLAVALVIVLLLQGGAETCSGWYKAEDRYAGRRSAACGTAFELSECRLAAYADAESQGWVNVAGERVEMPAGCAPRFGEQSPSI